MQSVKSITVIIPTFNRRLFITEAVGSVLDQDIDDLEIIVVDDGSTDGTRDALMPYRENIRYIYQGNQGVSAARNRGIQESRGELLAFLDSDDLWAPEKLKTQIDKVRTENVLCFEGVEWFVDREEDREFLDQCEDVMWPRCDASGDVIDPVLDVAEGRYFHLGTLLCRKSTFLEIGLFDESLCYGEDEDWFSRASLKIPFCYFSEPLLRRRFHINQIGHEREESIRSLIKVFGNIKARTAGAYPKAHAVANKRLAAKWSHLANRLADQDRFQEAAGAAWTAFSLEPLNMKRLVKTALLSCAMFRSGQNS
ncbi:glycosyltransferase family 2 protein [Methylobacter sp. sgz302048]|uniref:glycosyltransferase family 2 protein n=1 Tax=Methylobacter sp. sgz302048 TaxID=3455945 RepID=UPI003FA11A94